MKFLNKYTITAVLVAIGIAGYFIFQDKCEKPDDQMIAETRISCFFVKLQNPIFLYEEVCEKLKKGSSCNLNDESDQTLEAAINAVVDDCVKNSFEAQNLCTDKLE